MKHYLSFLLVVSFLLSSNSFAMKEPGEFDGGSFAYSVSSCPNISGYWNCASKTLTKDQFNLFIESQKIYSTQLFVILPENKKLKYIDTPISFIADNSKHNVNTKDYNYRSFCNNNLVIVETIDLYQEAIVSQRSRIFTLNGKTLSISDKKSTWDTIDEKLTSERKDNYTCIKSHL